MFMVFLFLLLGEPREKVELRFESAFEIESKDFFFSHPSSVVSLHNHKLYMMDEKSKTFVIYDLKSRQFQTFGEDSKAPEGISHLVGFFIRADEVMIISDFGKKVSWFSKSGTLLDTSRSPDALFFQEGSKPSKEQITVSSGEFFYEVEDQVVSQAPFFPTEPYGPYKYALEVGEFLLVATSTSNNQTFQVATFSKAKKQMVQRDTITKVQQFGVEDVPDAKAMGLTNENFRTSSYSTMVSVKDTAYFYEYMYPDAKEDELQESSMVHAYTPQTGSWSIYQVRHKDFSNLSFLIPMDDQRWFGFDSSEDRFVVFVRKIDLNEK